MPRIAAQMLGSPPPPRQAVRRAFRDGDGAAIDEGLALYFPAPASYTGEAVLELQGHGGDWVVAGVLQRVLALGARLARPGEFSERAFLNGKLDLPQAEAVADLISAGSDAAARAAVRSLQGEFSACIARLQGLLTGMRVEVEATIDFPEEDLDVTSCGLRVRSARLRTEFSALLATARQGALLRDGLSVVIAGKPNAGKSSLFNRLAGEAVAIVTHVPGTTRDLLRAHLKLDGLPVTITDTAGLRIATDPAEQEGIRRARIEMQRADRILFVIDAAVSADLHSKLHSIDELSDLATGTHVTFVVNKIDLVDILPGSEVRDGCTWLRLSAQTGAGMQLLTEHLKESAGYLGPDAGALSARRRHLDALERAQSACGRAEAHLHNGALELSADELRLAQLALSEVTGDYTSEDLLGEIFGSFCIGK